MSKDRNEKFSCIVYNEFSFTSPQGRFHPRTLFILKLLERVQRNICVGYFCFFLVCLFLYTIIEDEMTLQSALATECTA